MNRRDILKLAGITGFMGGLGTNGLLAAELQPPRQHFYAPDRIRYDGKSFFIEDQPFFIYSGSFHYFRCPRELWPARFEKIRDAGFNTIQTYSAWNYHEPLPPNDPDDYSRVHMEDLDAFLTMAADFGFYIIMRVGPYMCGEWDTGGFPQWLVAKIPTGYRGMWLRSDNPDYTRWADHWMGAVCPVVARHQLTRRPRGGRGIILMQVENEYGLIGMPLRQKKRHLENLIEQARGHGIRVPLFTNLAGFIVGSRGHLTEQVFDTIDRYPGWDLEAMGHRIRHYRTGQEDAPVMAAEMQGGWFTPVSATPSLRTDVDAYPDQTSPAQINALTLYSIAHGMTALNYYMLFGGTNFAAHAAKGVASSYDYSAAIRECGGVGGKWQKVRAIGAMLKVHGPMLARARRLSVRFDGGGPIRMWARQSPDGARYLFVFNSDRARGYSAPLHFSIGRRQAMTLPCRLAAADFNIFYLPPGADSLRGGRWLITMQSLMPRPHHIPAAVTITHVKHHEDPIPTQWKAVSEGQSLAQAGVYESGMSYYRCRLIANAGDRHGPVALTASLPGQDSVIARLDGELALPVASGGSPAILPLGRRPARTSEVIFLYENTGHWDNGWGMQMGFGLDQVGLMPYAPDSDMLTYWRIREITKLPRNLMALPEIRSGVDDADWRQLKIGKGPPRQIGHRKTGVLRTDFILSKEDIRRGKTLLRFGHISSRGWVFINGRQVGEATGDGATVEIKSAVRPGRNVMAVVVQVFGGAGGIAGVQILHQPDALGRRHGPMLLAARPGGVEQGWYKPNFDDAQWSSYPVGPAAVRDTAALMHWYRMKFTLPAVAADVWVPWCVRVEAMGNGFIYVNGHCVGRYWQHGGQREYYIPDNWFAPAGGENVVALCLRRVDQPVAVRSVAVRPYRVYAEFRKKKV
jgi:hypothetical protein